MLEEKVGELEGEQRGLQQEQSQRRELLECLRLQMEEGNARMANLGARWVSPRRGCPQSPAVPKTHTALKVHCPHNPDVPRVSVSPKPWSPQNLDVPTAFTSPKPMCSQILGVPKASVSPKLWCSQIFGVPKASMSPYPRRSKPSGLTCSALG